MKLAVLSIILSMVLVVGCEAPTGADDVSVEPVLNVLPVFHDGMGAPLTAVRSVQIPPDFVDPDDNAKLLVAALTPALLGFRSASGAEGAVRHGSTITGYYFDTPFTFDVTHSNGTFEFLGKPSGRDDFILLRYTPATKEFYYLQNVIIYQTNDPEDAGFDPDLTDPHDPMWIHVAMQGTVMPNGLSVHCPFEILFVDSDSYFADGGYPLVKATGEYYADGELSGIYANMSDFLRYQDPEGNHKFGPLTQFPTIADAFVLTNASFASAIAHFPGIDGQFIYRNVVNDTYHMAIDDADPEDWPWVPLD